MTLTRNHDNVLFIEGYDSGVSSTATSFKNSSTEEEPPGLKYSSVKRRGAIHSLMELKKTRPVSWHGRGRLELRIQATPVENDNPFRKKLLENCDDCVKTYDADDEEGDFSETKQSFQRSERDKSMSSMYTSNQQELIMKRKRPNSLIVYNNQCLPHHFNNIDYENTSKCKEPKKYDKRIAKKAFKESNIRKKVHTPRGQETNLKRKMQSANIGVSGFPKPYQPKELENLTGSSEKRRKSEDIVASNNLYNETSVRLRNSKDLLIERVKQTPLNIAEKQKLLKTRFFQAKSPQYSKDCLKLDIFEIKYQKLMQVNQCQTPKAALETLEAIKTQNNQRTPKNIKSPIHSKMNVKHEPYKKETPRTRSKYDSFKKLKEVSDKNLVLYTFLPAPKDLPVTHKKSIEAPSQPYKEPKDKYSIEYLWNIGANVHIERLSRKC